MSTSSAARGTLIATVRRQISASAWSQCPRPTTQSSTRCLASLARPPPSHDFDRDDRRQLVSPSPRRRPTSRTMTGRTSSPRFVRRFASAGDLPYHIVVGMPALSPTMESGTISKWNVAEGDSFSAGDSLAVIETDKASMDFEAQDDGVVAKLLVVEGGGEVKCGSPIMVTVEDAGDVGAFADFVVAAVGGGSPPVAATTPPPPPVAAAAVAAPAAADLPYHIVVGMPALSPTMESGTISKWNVAEGDAFSAGDSLAVIETDKASMDFEAQDDGVVARLLVSAGTENVSVGAAIMVTVEDAGDVGAFANFAAGTAPSSAVAATTPAAAVAPPAPPAAPAMAVAAAAAPTTTVAAAVAPPTAAAPVTAPAATSPGVVSSGGSEWGKLAARGSPLAKMMAVKQREYVKKYGSTGHVPVV
ncbi:hypothetical protein ACHAW5_008567 [Stephanodiscus triporus]|uniref:Lipoyl-binding domain-containing protein n=1 Tax=Stephanodiscus triporus TaxID=2934178 RepID=A0ABD3MN67_9STRA